MLPAGFYIEYLHNSNLESLKPLVWLWLPLIVPIIVIIIIIIIIIIIVVVVTIFFICYLVHIFIFSIMNSGSKQVLKFANTSDRRRVLIFCKNETAT